MMPRLLLLGCLVAAACDGGLSHRSYAEGAGSVPIDASVRKVRIEVGSGTVEVGRTDDVTGSKEVRWKGGVRRAADSAEALALVEQVPIGLVLAPRGASDDPAVLRLSAPHLPPGVAAVLGFEARLLVPARLELELIATGSCHVTTNDREAATTIETGRGDLRFGNCTGGLRARTGRGMVIAFDHRGDLDLHTMVGDIHAFVRAPGRLLRLVTGEGNVQCHVPDSLEFRVDARAAIGRIGNDFGLPVERVGDYGAAMVGGRGGDGTEVVLRTGKGHLTLANR